MDDRPRSGDRRVPPGQYVTTKWPVLTHGAVPSVAVTDYRLALRGLVQRQTTLSWTDLERLGRIEVTADFHCVTRFSTLDNTWGGFSTRTVLETAGINPAATHVLVHSYGGYTTNLPLEDFLSSRALLADRHDNGPLSAEHGGPLRLIVPHLYAWKSAKWVSAIELLESDARGFWEQNGYHIYGDPWAEERFSSQETRAAYEVRRSAPELPEAEGED